MRKDYEEPEQRFNGHVRDWASFMELVGPEGMKVLMGASTIGVPDAGTTDTL